MASFFLSDEEMGKKDDDHSKKPGGILPPIRPQHRWSPARTPVRKTLRRVLIALAACVAIYLFIVNIPDDLPIRDRRRPAYGRPPLRGHGAPSETVAATASTTPGKTASPGSSKSVPKGTTKPKEQEKKSSEGTEGAVSGPVRFLKLAASLQAIADTGGLYTKNKNILFAASSLKSAAKLLPMACQMGAELRSYVHFALMSRSEISLEELQQVNGIDESCQLIFHDARSEFGHIATDSRLGYSAQRAMHHINIYMHPQAMFIDGSDAEDSFFVENIRKASVIEEVSLIELPDKAPMRLGWVSKLDSTSLSAWNKVHIDILIHASAGTSGSLIRLLRSLTEADYTSCSTPHLTIELPHNVEAATEEYLKGFVWPPAHVDNPSRVQQLSIRRRIPRGSVNAEESSARFFESFWPASPKNNHILVLTPQAEVSPNFFHYLKYAVLEYQFSSAALSQEWDTRLMGISLDLPSTSLDANEPFTPPSKKDAALSTGAAHKGSTPFLWQAPNSNAVLILGEKWAELHSFVSRYMEARNRLYTIPPFFQQKHVSKRYPSWLEHALKLARARGYWTLYPGHTTAGAMVVVHNELFQNPEEYGSDELAHDNGGAEETVATGLLLDSLPGNGKLPAFSQLPLLSWDGRVTDLAGLDANAAEYADEFRNAIGGCEELLPQDLTVHASTSDLFCTKDD